MIEKTIAAAIEPIVDLIINLEKKVGEIDKKEPKDGKAGKDAEPVDIDKIKSDVMSSMNLKDAVKEELKQQALKELDEINQIFKA